MQNPFENLGKPSKSNVKYETIKGIFECDTTRCHSVVYTAKWLVNEELLTWVCENGHMNSIPWKEDRD